MPSDWKPGRVIDPATGLPFSDQSAWDFIADQLDCGCVVDVCVLERPPGRTGYVMKILMPGAQVLYVKLQLGAGAVIGRSFHYSYHD